MAIPDREIDLLIEGVVREAADKLNAAIADASENGILVQLDLAQLGGSEIVKVRAVGRPA